MILGVLFPTAASAFIIYCIVPDVRHGLVLVPYRRPKAMAHFVIVIASPHSSTSTVLLDTTDGVLSWRHLQQQHLEHQHVTGGHIKTTNNNVNTSSIKTMSNTMFFLPSPLSACTSPLSNVRTSVLLKGPAGRGCWHSTWLCCCSCRHCHGVVVAADNDIV